MCSRRKQDRLNTACTVAMSNKPLNFLHVVYHTSYQANLPAAMDGRKHIKTLAPPENANTNYVHIVKTN